MREREELKEILGQLDDGTAIIGNKLADGLIIVSVVEPSGRVVVEAVGRTTEEAVLETTAKVVAEIEGRPYTPRACTINPRAY